MENSFVCESFFDFCWIKSSYLFYNNFNYMYLLKIKTLRSKIYVEVNTF